MSETTNWPEGIVPVQYGKWTLGDATSMLKRVEKTPELEKLLDKVEFHEYTPQEMRESARQRFKSSISQYQTKELRDFSQAINEENGSISLAVATAMFITNTPNSSLMVSTNTIKHPLPYLILRMHIALPHGRPIRIQTGKSTLSAPILPISA